MNPTERPYNLYLHDMHTSIIRIESYVMGVGFESFVDNNLIADAVIRNFEIIGEAAKHIPTSVQKDILRFLGEKCTVLETWSRMCILESTMK